MAKQKANTEKPLETQLWKTADKLRKNIDAAEYKHIVLGLIESKPAGMPVWEISKENNLIYNSCIISDDFG